jgi:hypothetical protein
MNKPLLNKEINEYTEQSIIKMVRRMRLFDKIEISYSKTGELNWKLTRSDKGAYTYLTDNDSVV